MSLHTQTDKLCLSIAAKAAPDGGFNRSSELLATNRETTKKLRSSKDIQLSQYGQESDRALLKKLAIARADLRSEIWRIKNGIPYGHRGLLGDTPRPHIGGILPPNHLCACCRATDIKIWALDKKLKTVHSVRFANKL